MGIATEMKAIKLDILDQDGRHSDIWYSEKTRVVNLFQGFPEGAIYIGRSGKGFDGYFGNPISLRIDTLESPQAKRQKVLLEYKGYLNRRLEYDPIFRARVKALSGKTLVCFCVPKLCHGMLLAEAADRLWELDT